MYERTLVIGDSIAAGHIEDSGLDAGWPALLGVPEAMRQGVDGTTAVDWAGDKNGMLTRALGTDCDRVIVSLGGNDALALQANPGKFSPEAAIAAGNAVGAVVSAFRNKGRQVFILCYACPNPQLGDWRMYLGTMVLNGALQAACPSGTRFIRPGAVMRDPACWTGSGIHPSLYGHTVLARLIADALGGPQ